MHETDYALFDLRRGRPVCIRDSDGKKPENLILLATVEGLRLQTLRRLLQFKRDFIRLAVTQHRAQVMGLFSGEQQKNLSLSLDDDITPDQILRLSSEVGNFNDRDKLDLREASPEEIGGLALARLGCLLPAVVSVPLDSDSIDKLDQFQDGGPILVVTTEQIKSLASHKRVEVSYISDGPVPLKDAEDARFMFFREANGMLEHVAILIGDRDHWPHPVPVRIHSACLTGDLFGSLRCDCGEQLRESLRIFAEKGGGVVLYLAQEGRGIGLGNKLRAYTLQQDGLDTVDADCALGFGADERHYYSAVDMLRYLEIDRIQLLTNNPEKVRAMHDGGIKVVDRQPLYGTLNRHNLPYFKAKVNRAGHWLGELFSGAVPAK